MTKLNILISSETGRHMKRHPEVPWNRIAEEAVMETVRRLELAEHLTAASKLTQDHVSQLDHTVKASLRRRYGRS